MSSLFFGVVCIYLAFIILRMPREQFEGELDQITGKSHGEGYYRFMRGLVWALGAAGAAAIVLRFF